MPKQQGDVLLFQTDNDGDIVAEGGLVEMTGGLETAAYLSLFGGNEDDDGREDNPGTWWGNTLESLPERQYRGETQYLLRSLPAIPANLLRLEEAAKRDLSWFVSVGAATSITARASMPGVNRVRLLIIIEARGTVTQTEYLENWRANVQ